MSTQTEKSTAGVEEDADLECTVTTVCGGRNEQAQSVDGTGLEARIGLLTALCHSSGGSEHHDGKNKHPISFLVGDWLGAFQIRRFWPTDRQHEEKRHQRITSVLMDGGLLPVTPVLQMITAYLTLPPGTQKRTP